MIQNLNFKNLIFILNFIMGKAQWGKMECYMQTLKIALILHLHVEAAFG